MKTGDKSYTAWNLSINLKLGLKGFLFTVDRKLTGKDNVICEHKLTKVYNKVKPLMYRQPVTSNKKYMYLWYMTLEMQVNFKDISKN